MRPRKNIDKARTLRTDNTDAERLIWRNLRNRQLGVFRFRRQCPLHGFIVDFACIEANLIVELDGGQHADQIAYDEARSRTLMGHGFHVVRFWNHDVLLRTDTVLEELLRQLSIAEIQREEPDRRMRVDADVPIAGAMIDALRPSACCGSARFQALLPSTPSQPPLIETSATSGSRNNAGACHVWRTSPPCRTYSRYWMIHVSTDLRFARF